jgi:ABC-type multidrug transport system fused ATPase/permease subunit
MDELNKLGKGFYNKNSQLILSSIFMSALSSTIETVIVPKIIANIFNHIEDIDVFRNQIITLILVWIIIKFVYSLSTYYKRQLEPEMTRYITIDLINKIFNKYEHENQLTNISTLINKIQLIKRNFQEISYLVFTVFIPRFIVLLISCYTVFMTNKTLGLLIFTCIIIQLSVSTVNLNECVDKSFEENENKDILYEYIEDLFHNINTIELTPNGFEFEIDNILKLSNESKKIEQDSLDCVTHKQYRSYIANIITTCIIFGTIYYLYSNKNITAKEITTIILLITGIFDNMSEILYFIPEATSKFGTLLKNEQFLKELNYYQNHDIDLTKRLTLRNGNIELKNVTFHYENHNILDNFSLILPEKRFICLYGPSGSGKSTFINIIFGIEKPSSGNVFFGGNDISKYHLRETRKYISYINQNTTNLFNTTVYKNIIYGYKDSNEMKKHVYNLFDRFNFYDIFKNLDKNKEKWSFLNEEVGKLGENLSGGQKQIVHLLRLDLNNVSNTVILDEPSSALDDSTRESALNYIKYLNSKGKTILLITHDDYYKNICDYILKFSNTENPILLDKLE